MSLIGIPWALVASGGGSSLVSAYLMASYVALTLALPRFAAAVDRGSRKRVAAWIAATGFVVQACSAVALVMGAETALLAASGFVAIVLRSFDQVNRVALAKDLFSQDEYHALNRWMEVSRQLITLIAGGAAALVFSHGAISSVLAIDAGTYLISLALIGLLPREQATPADAPTMRPPGGALLPWANLRDAWALVSRDRRLLAYALATLVPFIVILAQNALYPAHFERYLGASAELFALDSLFYGAGAALAAAVVKVRERGISSGALVQIAFVGYLGALCATALIPHVEVTFAGSFVFALCHAVIRIERLTLLMRSFDDREIGRVTGFFEVVATASNVVLIGLVGLVVDGISVRAAWLLLAALLVPAALIVRSTGSEVSDRDPALQHP